MRFILKLITSVILSVVLFTSAFTVGNATESVYAVSNYIDRFGKETGCDAISVVVVENGEATFYGDPDGLYQIGSMTKAFTGLAVRKLIYEGLIQEDDKVSDIIPGFNAYYEDVPVEITINQLLMQTSGYTNSETTYPSAAEGMSLVEWVDSISGKKLSSKPGEKYAYSNVNFNLLGAVIEKTTGLSYKEYMKTEILEPLGLNSTFVGFPEGDANIVKGSRLGYRHSFTYEIPVIDGRIPAGYFYSNTTDMARWIEIWTGSADIPEEYKELVRITKQNLSAPGDYYAGWEAFDAVSIAHSGGTPNYSSRIIFSEDNKTGVCVLTNMNVAASTDSLCNGIYAEIHGGTQNGIVTDVWTVFDIIFTAVSALGLLIFMLSMFIKKLKVLIPIGSFTLIILLAICIVMPLAFGASLGEMMQIWAPYSFSGGLIMLVVCTIAITIKILFIKLKSYM